MSRHYFGTDGIRGTVGVAPITPDFVLRLAHAVGRVLKRSEERPTVLIGKDTRISGYMLESAMESFEKWVSNAPSKGASSSAEPVRKSAGFSKTQSVFKGSERQIRGQVLAQLRAAPSSMTKLRSLLTEVDPVRLQSVVGGLVHDGLIEQRGRMMQLHGE
jgi:hypothetical protein